MILKSQEYNNVVFYKTVISSFNELKNNIDYSIKLSQSGILKPITHFDIYDNELIKTLCNWRNQNAFAFPGDKLTTINCTREWLKEKVLNNPLRILFKIYSSQDEFIGHLGLVVSEDNNCIFELDNILRGVKKSSKGIMSLSILKLIKWTEKLYNSNGVFLKVLSNNQTAINFYNKINFHFIDLDSNIFEIKYPIYSSSTDKNIYFRIMAQNKKIIKHIKLNHKMDELERFENEKSENISSLRKNKSLQNLGKQFIIDTAKEKYSYNFSWMGRPIIAFPQDMIAMQEIIWDVKPDLIIETGIAHGGSLVYYASLLELIGGEGIVLGLDIDIREHNRKLIESHPMNKRIMMIEGDSTSNEVCYKVREIAKNKSKVLVCLDSNHTHEHVLKELNLYAELTSVGSYCIVFDTIVEDMPNDWDWGLRTWGVGNNPKTAVFEFLKSNDNFEIDKLIDSKLLISVAPDGYLKRIK